MSLLDNWRWASAHLGVEIREPGDIQLTDGSVVRPLLHVPQFGWRNGMLVFSNTGGFSAAALRQDGFGWSVLSPESAQRGNIVSVEELKEVLADWGWNGPDAEKPSWLS